MKKITGLSQILLFSFTILYCQFGFTEHAKTYFEAKQKAMQIWQDHRVSFYCDCKYNKRLELTYNSCSYQPTDDRRARRIEWEHIVPASWLGSGLDCWQQPSCRGSRGEYFQGRNCCLKIDKQYQKMHNDLYNLVPTIGEVNAARSSYKFVTGNLHPDWYYNNCEIIINEKMRFVIPKPAIRGWIARAFLYMEWQYPFQLTHQQKLMYNNWNKKYPPSKWELTWAKRVAKEQGNINPFIIHYNIKKK